MKTSRSKVFILVVIIAGLGMILTQVGAKRGNAAEDIYANYETLTTVIDKVLSNYVTEVDRQELFYGAYEGILQKLDPYSQFLPPQSKEDLDIDTTGEFGGVGIEITLDEHKVLSVITPLEGTPAYNAGVLAGDKIWKINGKATDRMGLTDAVKLLRGRAGTPVTITVTHETEPRKPVDIEITRDVIKIKSVVSADIFDEKAGIGYVRLVHFQKNTVRELDDAIESLVKRKMKALVLDLRFNPGGLLDSAVDVCDKFIGEGIIVTTKGRNNVTREEFRAHKSATYHFPMAVLVSAQSASASEIVSGCLQDHKRAAIIGTRTFGKGSVQSVIPLEDGKCAMRLTTAYYYTPSGRLIHRKPDAKDEDDWGIYPDIEVKMTADEYAGLWKQWRDRHIDENRSETQAIGAEEGEAGNVKTVDEPAAEAEDAENEDVEEKVIDKQLEAARLFLSGLMFDARRAAK